MVKGGKNGKSEGIEVLSIGKLYSGPWDKKYWSASRGKHRYPYPVGFKVLRPQSGATYTMEILEGLKGPLFTISSSDGKACSGDTPDMAWESFSKLYHGKRLAGKKEGIEFFGFNNSLVQRLLRELVANVDAAIEQNSLASNFVDGEIEAADELKSKASSSDCSLQEHLEESCVVNNKIIEPNESSPNSERQKEVDEVTNTQNGQSLVTDAHGYAPDTLDYFIDSSSTFLPISNEQGQCNLNDTNSTRLAMSATPASALVPEDVIKGSAGGSSSEFCDADSVDQDVATSMMTVLLPRALPLIKTYSRRKKKRERPPCTSNSTPLQSNNALLDDHPFKEPAKESDLILENEKACDRPGKSHQQDPEFADCSTSSNRITEIADTLTEKCKLNDELRMNLGTRMILNSKFEGLLKFVASYVHPMPILMVQLFYKEMNVYICVKCGYSDQLESTLFLYKASADGEEIGFPSLIGRAPIAFPVNGNRCLLQFAPDAGSLVLLNSIKTSYCSLSKLDCSCQVCTSACSSKSGVKIVRLTSGYVSLVTMLETSQAVSCFLVCDPMFLLVAEQGGELNLWIMNSEWSQQKEASSLPNSMLPCVIDLKHAPTSTGFVIGHNGLGEFGIWDISKRSLVSRFSSFPSLSVSECLPINVFRWQKRPDCKTETLSEEIMDATRRGLSWENDASDYIEHVGVWLLISTALDVDSDHYRSLEPEADQAKCWRLALLANHTVIVGSVIDKGVAAVTSSGHGIIGQDDGLVYVWELSTGMKLGNLHSFKDRSVSCVTACSSNSGSVAALAAGDELLVYLTS